MMKILMVEHFSPGNTYSAELCHELAKYADITVLCKSNAGEFAKKIDRKAVMYAGGEKNKLKAFVKYVKGIFFLAKEVKNKKYQVIHVQTFKNAAVEIPLYTKTKMHAKLIHTVHNVLPHETDRKDIKLYGDFYKACDHLIVHNEQSKKRLIEVFNLEDDTISVIPHGTYQVKKIPAVLKADKKKHYLMFGVIRRYKGVDVLLQAVSKIPKEKRSDMEFIIAGRQYDNQDTTDYAHMINDLGIGDCVKLVRRRIEDDELPELFDWADACIFPYREIYGSGALLMAYSFEKPVIASDVPVFVEETDSGSTGILFKNEDAESLAKALIMFSNMPQEKINRMIDSITWLTSNKYNWVISAKMTADIYNTVIKKKAAENIYDNAERRKK